MDCQGPGTIAAYQTYLEADTACRDDPTCIGFVQVGVDRFYTKNIECVPATHQDGFTFYRRVSDPEPSKAGRNNGWDCQGGIAHMDTLIADSYDDCLIKCKERQGCTGVVMKQGEKNCWLKRGGCDFAPDVNFIYHLL